MVVACPSGYREVPCECCHNVALLWKEAAKPQPGDPVLASNVKHVDGRQAEAGEPLVCDNCRRSIVIRLDGDWLLAIDRWY